MHFKKLTGLGLRIFFTALTISTAAGVLQACATQSESSNRANSGGQETKQEEKQQKSENKNSSQEQKQQQKVRETTKAEIINDNKELKVLAASDTYVIPVSELSAYVYNAPNPQTGNLTNRELEGSRFVDVDIDPQTGQVAAGVQLQYFAATTTSAVFLIQPGQGGYSSRVLQVPGEKSLTREDATYPFHSLSEVAFQGDRLVVTDGNAAGSAGEVIFRRQQGDEWLFGQCINEEVVGQAAICDDFQQGREKGNIPPQEEAEYDTYYNNRFEYVVKYPENLLKMQPPPQNNDGRSFVSSQGNIEMRVYGSHNVLQKTLDESYQESLQAYQKGGRVTYKTKKDNQFVISGYQDDGQVFYGKTIFHDGDVLRLSLSYDSSLQPKFDPIVATISRSFRPTEN